jgi:hypothetical protein
MSKLSPSPSIPSMKVYLKDYSSCESSKGTGIHLLLSHSEVICLTLVVDNERRKQIPFW